MSKVQRHLKTKAKIWCFFFLSLGMGISPGLIYPVGTEKISRGLEAIQSRRIQATLDFLASEHFKGRGTGTPEAGLAAAYIASIFRRNGLGTLEKESPSFIQTFQLSQALPREPSSLKFKSPSGEIKSLKMGEDFMPAPWGSDSPEVEGEAVFVGYGITAKEFHYDDYAKLPVTGKVVVFLSKYPDNPESSPFNDLSRNDYEDSMTKTMEAQKLGATGVIVILPSTEELPSPNELNFKKARIFLASEVDSMRIPSVFVSYKTGENLIQRRAAKGAETLTEIKKWIDDHLKSRSFVLDQKVCLQTTYEHRKFAGQNVIGIIPGSDPSFREEVIILGAHYDHLGVGENNEIFYGADDDASGTTGLLELAEAFQVNPVKPKRSLMLAAWGAEEVGLLGSKHYVRNPLVPLRKTGALIQLDMIGRNEERNGDLSKNIREEKPQENTNSLNVMGSPFSEDMKLILESCNEEVGLELRFRFDFGSDNLNKRSDHWSFLKEGIPSLLLFSGFHLDYHKASDTADKINFAKMEKILKLVYRACWELADRPQVPRFDNTLFQHKN